MSPVEKRKIEGERLKEVLEKLGLSYGRAASATKISVSMISDICNGSKALKDYHFLLMYYTLGISDRYIKNGEGEMIVETEKLLYERLIKEQQSRIEELKAHLEDKDNLIQLYKQQKKNTKKTKEVNLE
jgi:transcriptional regulator with XRE-family HTH domain